MYLLSVDKSEYFSYNKLMNKHTLILREIAAVYLPEYQGRADELCEHWRHYNVEHIVEDAMCRIGGYEFVDAHTHDNSDFSETKTGTIRRHDRTATISGILSDGGQSKCGDIRAVIYNQFRDELHYYFMPRAEWEEIREWGQANKNVLRAKYDPDTDQIYKWQRFRVGTFEQLARQPATVTSPWHFQCLASPRNRLFDWHPKVALFE